MPTTTMSPRIKRPPVESPIPGYLTTAEISARYNVAQEHVSLLIRRKTLPAIRVGWMYLVKEEDWLHYQESKEKRGAPRGERGKKTD